MPKRVPRFVLLLAGALLLASPASAKVSPSKAQQMCQVAMKVLQPAPKSYELDKSATQTASETVTVVLNVRTADDANVKVVCVVNRETSMVTLTPSTLAAPPPPETQP